MTPPPSRPDRPLRFTTALASIVMVLLLPTFTAAHLEDRIVAVVNSEIIMLSELQREVEPERARLVRQHRGDDLAHRLRMAESMALTRMIERKLQLQEAKAKNIAVSDQEVKQAIEQMKRRGEAIDMSNPVDVRNVRERLTLLRVVDLVVRSGITVGDAEMKRYYDTHRDRFAYPDEYSLSQILIHHRSGESAEALAKARQAMDELKRGEKFADVAMRYSDGADALRGGRLGLVRQGELLPAIERAVEALPPGGISDIIESRQGFHIILVEEKHPKQFRPFDDVQLEIQEQVFQQKSEELFQSWLVGLKKKAHIEIKF